MKYNKNDRVQQHLQTVCCHIINGRAHIRQKSPKMASEKTNETNHTTIVYAY